MCRQGTPKAVDEPLVASELFGHVKGAFTGATENKTGLLKAVNGGAIFLDEIGTMPQHVQAKLLRVVQEKEYRPVGSSEIVKLDKGVRVFAATNDPEKLREDLLWRFPERIDILPLRNRISDVFGILQGFLAAKREDWGIPENIDWSLDIFTVPRMVYSPWRGNIRELENAARRSVQRWDFSGRTGDGIPFSYVTPKDDCEMLSDEIALSRLFLYCTEKCKSLPTEGRPASKICAYLLWLLGSQTLDRAKALPEVYSSEDDFERMYDVRPDTLEGSLILLDHHRTVLFGIPPALSEQYNPDGSRRKTSEEGKGLDLTAFTYDEILTEYVSALMIKHNNVKAHAAKAARITPNRMKRLVDEYGS